MNAKKKSIEEDESSTPASLRQDPKRETDTHRKRHMVQALEERTKSSSAQKGKPSPPQSHKPQDEADDD